MDTHNLNIHMYSLKEILDLFQLTYTISEEDMKRAKKKVLMLHPDKSRLSSDYFLFYKKAYEVVYQYYENQTKMNKVVPKEEVKYQPTKSDWNKSTDKKVTSVINTMSKTEFNNKFNELFENNMIDKPVKTQNEWFSQESPIYETTQQVSSKNMGQIFDTFKERQNGLTIYKGVQEMIINGGASRLYGDDDDDDNNYVCSDPFSKLKYDDLRKVHKDQTIFSVSEKDYTKVKKYQSVDHLNRERGTQLSPMEKAGAERILATKNKMLQEQIMQKEYEAQLKTMHYAEKTKSVLSAFLHIGNG